MGWTMLPKPGSKRGPCDQPCSHADCNGTRADAVALCRLCRTPIGYEVPVYADPERDTAYSDYVHASCLDEAVERLKRAGQSPETRYVHPLTPEKGLWLTAAQVGDLAGFILDGLFDAIRQLARPRTMEYRCSACGCPDLQFSAWIDANTGEANGDDYNDDVWCPRCETHYAECCMIDLRTGACTTFGHAEPQRDPPHFWDDKSGPPTTDTAGGCPGAKAAQATTEPVS